MKHDSGRRFAHRTAIGIQDFRQLPDDRNYKGRVNHIHLKVHIAGYAESGAYRGGHVAHTGQIFFPDDITKSVIALKPYSQHHIERTTLEEDGIYNGQNGRPAMAQRAALNKRSIADGYVAFLTLGIDPNKTPEPVHMFGPPPQRER